jgi:hypothetical protein
MDIAIMKLSRFTAQDRDDIKTLISEGYIDDVHKFRQRAVEALDYYVGKPDAIQHAINDVCEWIGAEHPSPGPE